MNLKSHIVNIEAGINGLKSAFDFELSEQSKVNLPPRIRMAALYAVSQSYNGRVANTCNLSEDWVGYSTRYGDAAGDFSPISNLTVSEVRKIGAVLNLPDKLVNKVPNDGLSNQSDEDKLGVKYKDIAAHMNGEEVDPEVEAKIEKLHNGCAHKFNHPSYKVDQEKEYQSCY